MATDTKAIHDMEDDDNTIEPKEAADQTSADNGNAELAEGLRRERDELQDRLLRKTAEFDNYRKRVEKERRELNEWAAADVLTDVLSVLDDFERALAVEAPAEAQSYRSG